MTIELALLTPLTTAPIPPPPPSVPPPNGPLVHYLEHPGAANATVLHTVGGELGDFGSWAQSVVVPFGIAVLIAVLVGVGGVVALRHYRARCGDDGSVFGIALPPEVRPDAAERLWTNLHDLLRPSWKRFWRGQPHLSFEIVWRGPMLSFQFHAPRSLSQRLITHAVSAAWPGAGVTVEAANKVVPEDAVLAGGTMRLSSAEWLSIKTDHHSDPLATLLGSIGDLDENQGAVVQVLMRPVTSARMAKLGRVATSSRSGRSASLVLRLLDLVTPGHPSAPVATAAQGGDGREITNKVSSLGWEGTVYYGVFDTGAPSRQMRHDLASRGHGLASAYTPYTGRNRLQRRRLRNVGAAINERRMHKPQVFSVSEVAALAHLPLDTVLPGVVRAPARRVAPVTGVAAEGKIIGDSDAGTRRAVAVSETDSPFHFHVLGSTGSGKSTLLINMVLSDVEAGRGAVVIDPKGDLVTDILDRLDSEVAEERVILLDPDEESLVTSLDVLAHNDKNKNLVADNLVGIFGRIFASYWGPRTDDVLRTACLTLMDQGRANLAEVPTLLSDKEFRQKITGGLSDHSGLSGFWSWYESMSDAQQSQVIGPVLSKLRAFFLRDFVRMSINPGRPRLDLDGVVGGNKLLLARLPKGLLGSDTSKLLGSMIVARVWQTSLARIKAHPGERLGATLYLDECHNFLNMPGSVDEMLAEARGYGLSLVLAHQHLGQLSREMRDAISANARNKVYFSMSPEDAYVLERHVSPDLTSDDLNHLAGYQVAARLIVNGREVPACTVATRPPHDVGKGNAVAVREALRNARRAETVSRSETTQEEGVDVDDALKQPRS